MPFLKKLPNTISIYKYFGLKNIPSPDTAFKNIFQIKPGQTIEIDENKLRFSNFWSLPKKK